MYFDSHLHTEGLGFRDLKEMAEIGIKEVCSLAFYPIRPNYPQTMIDVFRKLVEFETARCKAVGIEMYPAVGIHPRCIPPEYDVVLRYLEEGEWIAFGEIGLETGGREEVDVLTKQLSIAKKLDVPCIIHTPRGDKRLVTEKILGILEKLDFPETLAVIDHVNFENLDLVEKTGYWIGLTVQPGKLSPDDVVRIVSDHGAERFMLNSDVGYKDTEITTVAVAAEKLKSSLGVDVMGKVAYSNARRFLRL